MFSEQFVTLHFIFKISKNLKSDDLKIPENVSYILYKNPGHQESPKYLKTIVYDCSQNAINSPQHAINNVYYNFGISRPLYTRGSGARTTRSTPCTRPNHRTSIDFQLSYTHTHEKSLSHSRTNVYSLSRELSRAAV